MAPKENCLLTLGLHIEVVIYIDLGLGTIGYYMEKSCTFNCKDATKDYASVL